MSGTSRDSLVGKQMVRYFGAFALVAGGAELIVGIIVYTDLSDWKYGAWWAAVGIMVGSSLGVMATSRFIIEQVYCILI